MESYPHRGFHLAHRHASLLTCLCIVVLLLYLLLPEVYYNHLTASPLSVSSADPRGDPLAIGTHPEESPGPYHDSNSCPICQAFASFQDYAGSPLLQAPDCALPAQLFVPSDSCLQVKTFFFLITATRAPPHSL